MSTSKLVTSADVRPEFIRFARLPRRGRCPYTGLSKSHLRQLERDGLIRLTRIIRPGFKRGTVMIPIEEVLNFIRLRGEQPRALTNRQVSGGAK